MTVFLDTDVIVDLLTMRDPFFNDSRELFTLIEDKKISASTSVLVIANIYYLIAKFKGKDEAKKAIIRLRLLLTILSVDPHMIDLALSSGFKDFEDGVQYCCAISNGLDIIVTRNIKDYPADDQKMIIMSPDEFLRYLKTKSL